MIAPCTAHIPIKKIPAHVIVVRDGQRLHNPPKPTTTQPVTGTKPTGTSTTGTTTAPYGVPPPPTPEILFLQVGDQIIVRRPAVFTVSYDGNRYRIRHASVTL